MRALHPRVLAAALALGAAVPLAAAAQSPSPRLLATPRVGMVFPFRGAAVDRPQDAVYTFGLTAELTLPPRPVDLRAGLEYVPAYELAPLSACNGDPACRAADGSLLVTSADLQLRPMYNALEPNPYLLVGAGLKRYDFRGASRYDDQVRGALHLGGGVEVLVRGRYRVVTEVSDYIGRLAPAGVAGRDAPLRNDLFVTAGVRFPVP